MDSSVFGAIIGVLFGLWMGILIGEKLAQRKLNDLRSVWEDRPGLYVQARSFDDLGMVAPCDPDDLDADFDCWMTQIDPFGSGIIDHPGVKGGQDWSEFRAKYSRGVVKGSMDAYFVYYEWVDHLHKEVVRLMGLEPAFLRAARSIHRYPT